MSYILDALKKAQAEQNPDVASLMATNDRQQRRQRFIQYLMIAALAGNALLLVWLFAPLPWHAPAVEPVMKQDAAEKITAAREPLDAAAPAPSAQAGVPGTGAPDNPQSAPAPTKPAASPAAAAVPKPPTRTTLAGLPPGPRSRFPGLSFSTHLYASDPSMRAVVVNGKRLTQGDRLGSLQLTRITEEGVEFRFEDYLVSVSVLEDWE